MNCLWKRRYFLMFLWLYWQQYLFYAQILHTMIWQKDILWIDVHCTNCHGDIWNNWWNKKQKPGIFGSKNERMDHSVWSYVNNFSFHFCSLFCMVDNKNEKEKKTMQKFITDIKVNYVRNLNERNISVSETHLKHLVMTGKMGAENPVY